LLFSFLAIPALLICCIDRVLRCSRALGWDLCENLLVNLYPID